MSICAAHWQEHSSLVSDLSYILGVHLHCFQKVNPLQMSLWRYWSHLWVVYTNSMLAMYVTYRSGTTKLIYVNFNVGWIAERGSSGMPHWTTGFPYNFQTCLRKALTRGTVQQYVETVMIEGSKIKAHENPLVATCQQITKVEVTHDTVTTSDAWVSATTHLTPQMLHWLIAGGAGE